MFYIHLLIHRTLASIRSVSPLFDWFYFPLMTRKPPDFLFHCIFSLGPVSTCSESCSSCIASQKDSCDSSLAQAARAERKKAVWQPQRGGLKVLLPTFFCWLEEPRYLCGAQAFFTRDHHVFTSAERETSRDCEPFSSRTSPTRQRSW